MGIELDQLLRDAATSLEDEDKRMRSAFDARPRSDERSRSLSRGLAYWVFETTLAHEIFKGWLRLVDVDHEVPYPADRTERTERSKKADLVVFDDGAPSLVVECKWWPDDRRKTLDALDGDVEKLRSWPGDVQRLLLTFWASPDEHVERDEKSVSSFANDPRFLAPVWQHRFKTHHYDASRQWHFAMAALRVTPLV